MVVDIIFIRVNNEKTQLHYSSKSDIHIFISNLAARWLVVVNELIFDDTLAVHLFRACLCDALGDVNSDPQPAKVEGSPVAGLKGQRGLWFAQDLQIIKISFVQQKIVLLL